MAQVASPGPSGLSTLHVAVTEAEGSKVSLLECMPSAVSEFGPDVDIDPDAIWDLIDPNELPDFLLVPRMSTGAVPGP